MCLTLLQDSRLYQFLFTIDREFAERARADGCHCSGRVHRADYERKPRGGPSALGPEYHKRFSFCCKEGNVVSFITSSAGCRTSPTLHRRKLSRLGHRFLGFLTLALDTFERLLRGNSDRLSY